MDKIINKFSLTSDQFMPNLQLRKQRFAYDACGSFTKHPKRNQKFKERCDLSDIIKCS